MKQRKAKFKMFMPWQDEQEQNWLEEMSTAGLHLARLKGIGSYEFEVGEPAAFIYRLDYQEVGKKDREDYQALFADAGWEYIGEKSGWQYFRKLDQPGVAEEIFTDMSSKIAKYKRVLRNQFAMLTFYFTFWIIFSGDLVRDPTRWFYYVAPGIFVMILVFFAVNYFKTAQRIKELEQAGLPVEENGLG